MREAGHSSSFEKQRPRLPNNRPQSMKRAKILTDSLRKNPIKGQHLTQFMGKIFIEGHVEPVPALTMKRTGVLVPSLIQSKPPQKT